MSTWRRLRKWADKHPIFRHVSWMMSGSLVQALIAFGSNLALMRLLEPEDFGRFAIVFANIKIVSAVLNFRVPDLVLRTSANDFDEERTQGYWSILLVETVLILIVTVALLGPFGMLGKEAIFLLVGNLISRWVYTQIKIYERKFAYREISWIQTGGLSLSHVFSVMGALCGMGPLVLYLRELVGLVLQSVGLKWAGCLKQVSIRMLDADDLRRLFNEIRGFWAEGMLQQLYERLIVLSIGEFAGERAAGFYAQANRLAVVPLQLLAPVAERIMYNYFSHKVAAEKRLQALFHTYRWIAAPLIIAGLGAIWFADPVVPTLFGAKWEPVAALLSLMVGVIVFRTPLLVLRSLAMSRAQMRPFLIFGRGVPMGCLGVGIATAYVLPESPWLTSIAISVSAGYTLSVILLTFFYSIVEPKAAVNHSA